MFVALQSCRFTLLLPAGRLVTAAQFTRLELDSTVKAAVVRVEPPGKRLL